MARSSFYYYAKQDSTDKYTEVKAKIERDKAEAERKILRDQINAKIEAERKAKEESDRKEADRIAAEKKAAKAAKAAKADPKMKKEEAPMAPAK